MGALSYALFIGIVPSVLWDRDWNRTVHLKSSARLIGRLNIGIEMSCLCIVCFVVVFPSCFLSNSVRQNKHIQLNV